MGAFNLKYYTLDLIPRYRSDFINLRLRGFIDMLNLKKSSWPIDCTILLDKIKELEAFPFEYGFLNFRKSMMRLLNIKRNTTYIYYL